MDNNEAFEEIKAMEAERAAAERYYASLAEGLNDMEFAGLLHATMKERNRRLARLERDHPGINSLTERAVRNRRQGNTTNPDF